VNEPKSDATQEDGLGSAPAVRARHDEVGLRPAAFLEDLFDGRADPDDAFAVTFLSSQAFSSRDVKASAARRR